MLGFLKNEHMVNTCIILALIVILTMIFMNYAKINKNSENFCGCGNPNELNIQPNQLQPNQVQSNQLQPNQTVGGKNKLILYYALWCGFSVQFLPVWEEVKKLIGDSSELNVECLEYDCDKDRQICTNAAISGFPSIVLVKSDGSKMPYTGERSASAILSFLKTIR